MAPRLVLALAGITLAVLVTISAILLDRTRPIPARRGFSELEVEQANLEVLPFRQSGLVYHWADDAPAVYVRRSMWEGLPEETKRHLGRSMAIAKNRVQINLLDETLTAKLAICTAEDGCTPVRN
jgi:hypothetical protein